MRREPEEIITLPISHQVTLFVIVKKISSFVKEKFLFVFCERFFMVRVPP
jgi:hypothetical protein